MKAWCKVYFKDANSMQEVEDESIQLVIVSPPDIARWIIEMQSKLPQKKWDLLFPGYYFGFQCFHNLFMECYRLLKSDGVLLFNIGVSNKDYTKSFDNNQINCLFPYVWVANILYATELKIQEDFICVKTPSSKQILPARDFIQGKKILSSYEHFFLLTKSDHWKMNIPEKNVFLSTIWYANFVPKFIDGEINVTPFNETLIERIVELFTDEGDVVLDPMAGTGTLGKVAVKMDRNCILYEIDKRLEPIIKAKVGEALIEDPVY